MTDYYKAIVVGIVLFAIFIIVAVIQVQETNRKFIENGYSQIQMQGTTSTAWIRGGR